MRCFLHFVLQNKDKCHMFSQKHGPHHCFEFSLSSRIEALLGRWFDWRHFPLYPYTVYCYEPPGGHWGEPQTAFPSSLKSILQ